MRGVASATPTQRIVSGNIQSARRVNNRSCRIDSISVVTASQHAGRSDSGDDSRCCWASDLFELSTLSGGRLVNDETIHDGHDDLSIFDLVWIDLNDVLRKDDQVSEFTGRYRAFFIFLKLCER